MDMSTLAKVLTEANRLLPEFVREEIATQIEAASKALEEFADEFANAVQESAEDNQEDVWATYKDNITPEAKKDVSFEDVLKGWDFTAAEQPGAESAGSEDSVASITRSLYRFMTENEDDYAPWQQMYEDWNVANPIYIVIDYLKYLAEEEITRLGQEG